jgi:hypothetical protein
MKIEKKEDTLMPPHPCTVQRPLTGRIVRLACGAALTFLAVGLFTGCSRPVGEVSGSVYFKEKVVTSGSVTMVGADGVPKRAEIAEDGSFVLAGVPVGEATIAVSSPPFDPKKGTREPPTRVDPETGKPIATPNTQARIATDEQRRTWREIPVHFSDVTKSNLKYTVTTGPNSHDIKLE